MIAANGAAAVLRPATREEAIWGTEQIRAGKAVLSQQLLDAHDRAFHRAMGYGTWNEYVVTEFNLTAAQGYYLINQARTIAAIETAAGVSNVFDKTLTIRTSTDLRPRLEEATAEIRDRVEAGEPPEEAVAEVIEKYRTPNPTKPKLGTKVYKGKAADEVLGNVMSSLRATAHTVAGLQMEQFTDDAPALEWVKEIDRTVRELRSLRSRLRERYGIAS